MWQFVQRFTRKRRALRYAKAFPGDLPAVQAVLLALELNAKNAREAAEILAGRALTDREWSAVSPRWERTWQAVKP